MLSSSPAMPACRAQRLPGRGLPLASRTAFTAPQLVWPMTTMTFDPRCSTAYSAEARPCRSGAFPASRMVKRRPASWSKRRASGTRLSEQVMTTAKGAWPFTRAARMAASWPVSRVRTRLPATKRALPSLSSARAALGVAGSASVGAAAWAGGALATLAAVLAVVLALGAAAGCSSAASVRPRVSRIRGRVLMAAPDRDIPIIGARPGGVQSGTWLRPASRPARGPPRAG